MVLIHQSQGTGAGNYDVGVILSVGPDTLVLEKPLQNAYEGATYLYRANGECEGRGMRGEYFNNVNLTGSSVLTRCDAQIRFGWEAGSPDGSLPADNFSVRWTGELYTPISSTYEFTVAADDGFRFYIDDMVVPAFDRWTPPADATYVFSLSLSAGTHSVKVEYYEETGNAKLQLQSPTTSARPQT
ncbi:MAG: hypothetical protein H0T73_13825 [Ardenticatenales bacterium]|nr:hypothetical protein [Ardenticatenales bacterium]